MQAKYTFFNISLVAILLTCCSPKLGAQCFMDRHNTTWHDGWISCHKKESPNPNRPSSHWLMYSLGHRYVLGESYWWNHNDPQTINYGAKSLGIDYSLDGIHWVEWGNWTLDVGNGNNHYEGQSGPDFQGVEARFVLITVLDNYGGDCAGISEVKIDVELSTATHDVIADNHCVSINAFPNPFHHQLNISINTNCAGTEHDYFVEDVLGRKMGNTYHSKAALTNTSIDVSEYRPGVYFLVVQTGDQQYKKKIIKID